MKKLTLILAFALAFAAITFSLAVCAEAQTVTYLAKFGGTNGNQPYGGVVQATDGNFYGTTAFGGNGNGNVFRMTPSGKVTSIYSFCSQANCADGQTPETAPILGSDGSLYGVTLTGGRGAEGAGAGVFYKMTLSGKITILHVFCPGSTCGTEGILPHGITLASDGNFYGTTNYGGAAGVGAIFRLTPTGTYKTLYSFCSKTNCADGSYAVFPPIQGRDGNFYGATIGGGTNDTGVLYRFTASGAYQVLHNFCAVGCTDGDTPNTLVQDAQGNFFGTTIGAGIAFEFPSTGQYKVLSTIVIPGGTGGEAQQLTLASDGNLYGNTGGGTPLDGGNGIGGLFEVTPSGKFTALYAFCNCGTPTSGYNPEGQLFQGTDGNFYGTTMFGGVSGQNYGTVFKLSKGLNPSVQTVPVAGKVGKQIIILGNKLTGTTGVTFNGVQATFTVKSDTYISATVPAGASTGTVSVITPSATLKSNPQFVVTK
jgi:uncharacterized repeat protein (TIGR03803 family)